MDSEASNREKRDQARKMAERRGIPMRLARQVVEGQITMGQVMRKLMQRKKMELIAKQHGLERSLAGNVAAGEMTVEEALMRQKLHRHHKMYGERSFFIDYESSGDVALYLAGGDAVTGRIVADRPYEVEVQQGENPPRVVPKLMVKMACPASVASVLQERLDVDREVKQQTLEPILRIEKRYHIKNRELVRLVDAGHETRFVTLDGDVVAGPVIFFTRYEIHLRLDDRYPLYLMRHAVVAHHT